MFASNAAGPGSNSTRPIESISRAARALMEDIAGQRRPCSVQSGDYIVYSYDMGVSDGLDRVIESIAREAAGRKLRYRNGKIEMYEIGDKRGVFEDASDGLRHLMMHVSGYLKLMNATGYYDVSKFDLSLYTKADSISFSVTLYRA